MIDQKPHSLPPQIFKEDASAHPNRLAEHRGTAASISAVAETPKTMTKTILAPSLTSLVGRNGLRREKYIGLESWQYSGKTYNNANATQCA